MQIKSALDGIVFALNQRQYLPSLNLKRHFLPAAKCAANVGSAEIRAVKCRALIWERFACVLNMFVSIVTHALYKYCETRSLYVS